MPKKKKKNNRRKTRRLYEWVNKPLSAERWEVSPVQLQEKNGSVKSLDTSMHLKVSAEETNKVKQTTWRSTVLDFLCSGWY